MKVNEEGQKAIAEARAAFTKLDRQLKKLFIQGGREVSLVFTNLEIASMFAVKALSIQNIEVEKKFDDVVEDETDEL